MLIPSCSDRNDERVETTFWEDFTIADKFGKSAIEDTYKRSLKSFKGNIKYMTELAMTLNHKIWQLYETNEPLAKVYNKLWQQCEDYIYENFNGDDLSFYHSITD